jgi:hypothetical protein
MGYVIIIPLTINKRKIMQYFILRKIKIWGKDEFDVDSKAHHGYPTLDEAITKKIALETLNTNKDVSYILANDGTPTEKVIESIEEETKEQSVNI